MAGANPHQQNGKCFWRTKAIKDRRPFRTRHKLAPTPEKRNRRHEGCIERCRPTPDPALNHTNKGKYKKKTKRGNKQRCPFSPTNAAKRKKTRINKKHHTPDELRANAIPTWAFLNNAIWHPLSHWLLQSQSSSLEPLHVQSTKMAPTSKRLQPPPVAPWEKF